MDEERCIGSDLKSANESCSSLESPSRWKGIFCVFLHKRSFPYRSVVDTLLLLGNLFVTASAA